MSAHTPVFASPSMPAPPALRCACGKTFEHCGGMRAENALQRHQKTCAAPDLLDALDGIEAAICSYLCPDTGDCDGRCVAVREAIKKARGQ